MVAAKLANMVQGARTDLAPIGGMSQDSAATLLNVGTRSVQRAREVINEAPDELVRAVEQGSVSVSLAAQAVALPERPSDPSRATLERPFGRPDRRPRSTCP